MKTAHEEKPAAGVREDVRTGQYVPTLDGVDTSPTSFDEARALQIAEEQAAAVTTHDYTTRYWGHDYTISSIRNNGADISMMGWGHGISDGDFILLQNNGGEPGANRTTRYRVKTVHYMSNPRDMWRMEAEFAPREPHNQPNAPCLQNSPSNNV